MILLGMAGQAGSGKDSVADYLVARYGFVKFSFSDALYREVATAFGLEDETLLRDRATKEVPTEQLSLAHCTDSAFNEVAIAEMDKASMQNGYEYYLYPWGVTHSPRQILQWWGTEYRRAQDPDYWVKQAERFVESAIRAAPYPELAPQRFVNTSVRFANERAWVHEMGGNVWHMRRQDNAPVAAHVSETPLDVIKREREIFNNGTLDYLYKGVDQLLNTHAQFVRLEPLAPMIDPQGEA